MNTFGAIVMDPPWLERGGGKCKRGADRHYPLMKVRDIHEAVIEAPVWQPGEHTHLYMWVTNNFLRDGLWLMDELGFRYVTNLVWTKDRAGLGQYFRGQHELCLFGVRKKGKGFALRTGARNLTTIIRAPRKKHSAKPEEIFELIEARTEGPYLEMFSRQPREGWTVWGNDEAVQ